MVETPRDVNIGGSARMHERSKRNMKLRWNNARNKVPGPNLCVEPLRGGGFEGSRTFFSPTAECNGVFAQYRFLCVLGELGRFRVQKPGSGNRFRELVPGAGSGNHSMGSDRLGSVPEVWTEPVLGAKGIKKVPDSGDSVPKVPKVTLYFESVLLYFESILILSFERALLYFESILLSFESILLYFESTVYLFCPLKGPLCTLKVYFCTLKGILLYFESILLCSESIQFVL